MIATEREVQILQAAVGPLDTPELRARYAAEGLSETRYLWDLLWASRLDTTEFYKAGLNDAHITTALRAATRKGAQASELAPESNPPGENPMTLTKFLEEHQIPLRQYGKARGCYLVFQDEVPEASRWSLFHLSDYYVSSAVSGPGYVLCVRIHDARENPESNPKLTKEMFQEQKGRGEWPATTFEDAKRVISGAAHGGKIPLRGRGYQAMYRRLAQRAAAQYQDTGRLDLDTLGLLNPPRIYPRLRKEGYAAEDAHWIATQHELAADLDITIEWTEDGEIKGAWLVTARAEREDGQKVRESLVVDLDNQVGPDARHSNPYQYDAEAQVIAEVVAQL